MRKKFDIPEYGSFFVCRCGRVMRDRGIRDLPSHRFDNGYIYVDVRGWNLYRKGKPRKWIPIHSVVAEHFVPNPDGLPIVNHKDGDKTHNSAGNLEWVTQSENQIHAIASGLRHVKIAPDQRSVIRSLYKSGKYKQRELAEMYGVTTGRISQIVNADDP